MITDYLLTISNGGDNWKPFNQQTSGVHSQILNINVSKTITKPKSSPR